ncbi:urease accessory protein UreE [Hoeflea olei]|uniref:Urease accessory protein UreE n=1 Tax=Hoeflea olei TaxID=1480615 RepID=A0A1C1YPP8_9HYPH|nr:urease accessory protein UreE [Hoeflea olei]OCW55533.1 urease accessory protein UreE [Hoeflea olei]
MLTATSVTRQFSDPAATITLDETARHRRRMMMTSDRTVRGGTIAFLLDLPAARLLRHGDGLVLSDGRIVEVRARPEALMHVEGRDATHLLTLAWQIGNRHLAAEISASAIRIRRDHVIRDMLVGLGARVSDVEAPFDPEGGAYGGAHAAHTHHDHHHPHDHSHDQTGGHDHGPHGHRHD